MSLFPLQAGVANRIDKLQWNLLWGGVGDEFKFHIINWSKVYYPISKEKRGEGSVIYLCLSVLLRK